MVVFVVIMTLVAAVISLLGPLLFGKILALSLVGADTTGVIVYDGKAGQQSSFRARTYEFATTDGSKQRGAIAQKFPKSIGDRTQVRYLPALPSLNMEIAPTSGSWSLPMLMVAHSFLILMVALLGAFAVALIVFMASMTWRSGVFFGRLVRAEQPAP